MQEKDKGLDWRGQKLKEKWAISSKGERSKVGIREKRDGSCEVGSGLSGGKRGGIGKVIFFREDLSSSGNSCLIVVSLFFVLFGNFFHFRFLFWEMM